MSNFKMEYQKISLDHKKKDHKVKAVKFALKAKSNHIFEMPMVCH